MGEMADALTDSMMELWGEQGLCPDCGELHDQESWCPGDIPVPEFGQEDEGWMTAGWTDSYGSGD